MFGKKKYELTMNRVHDRIRVREGNEVIDLTVDGDPARMVAALNTTQAALKALSAESTEEEILRAAVMFAKAIFGKDQAAKLVEFYHNDPGCVVNVCSKYFAQRLCRIITKQQKRAK